MKQNKKMLLLVNPVAGRSALNSQMIEILDIFIKGGYLVTTVVTQSEEHLRNCIREDAQEYDTVVCCGGDGTLSITVNELVAIHEENRPVLGYIPCGTTNDFSKSRGISSIPVEAARQIAVGSEHDIDIIFLGGKSYVYVAAFGVFSEVSYATPRELKQNIGHAAYVFEGIKSLSKNNVFHIKFKINGEIIEGDFMYGMFSNTRRIGGFELPIIGNFSLDDGLIDITLVKKPENLDNNTKLINALITQKADDNMVIQCRASEIEYECDEEIPWTLDGEFGGKFAKQTMTLKPNCIRMVY